MPLTARGHCAVNYCGDPFKDALNAAIKAVEI